LKYNNYLLELLEICQIVMFIKNLIFLNIIKLTVFLSIQL